jgi:hypothetical protein
MANQRPIQLPQELIGIIASAVASDRNPHARLQALAACTLVCRSFAPEFRPYLFETLFVREDDFTEDEIARRLCAHARVLEDHPEYQRMVKTVVLVLAPYPPSVWQDARFPLWLKGLTFVSELVISTCDEELNFADIPAYSQDAIIRLGTSPSILKLDFDEIYNLPARIFYDAPNLQYLNLGAVTMDASFAEHALTEDELELLKSTRPLIHLNLHHTVDQAAQITLQALIPVIVRIWKLSGEYQTMGDVVLSSMCMVGGRQTLRDLELALGGE